MKLSLVLVFSTLLPMVCAAQEASVATTAINGYLYHDSWMAFPIQVCTVCSEDFELKPDKPGFANRCPACSEPEHADPITKQGMDADERKALMEANEAQRRAMRDLLYRKDG
jgi:hypothetical protein